MCGIAGFIDKQRNYENAEQLIERMCHVMRHRGPDDQGIWIGDSVALGMRRLAIIDIASGHQPISNEDQSVLVVFNGEIYNFRELRQQLQAQGHRFQTTCDTEVIVHAYEEYGDDCVIYLRGMFAFALWDRKRQRLLAARDRFGKKPFNYFWDGQRLIFGSEIKSIVEADISRNINPLALDEFLLYRYIPTPHTLFQGISKLPAAHILIYENGQITTKRYWELPFTPTNRDDEATAIEKTRLLIQEAVQMRLVSEVPLGAFLSGGVDSSIVVGFMSKFSAQPVQTFAIGFEEEAYSELFYARQVASHFGTNHHEFVVQPDLVSVLPELVWAYDEPFADSSMLPTYYVSKLAREYVTVVLTGDGGDEIFGGYTRYQRELSINRIPLFFRLLMGYGGMLLPDGMRGKNRLNNLRYDFANRYMHVFQVFPNSLRASMYSQDYASLVHDHDPGERLISELQHVSHLDITSRMQYADVRNYLADDILVKVDKASMINSLEARAPLLDHYLAEYVSSLPAKFRVRDGELKYLLKKVAQDILPANILSRPKQGFAVPIKHWFRNELNHYTSDLLCSRQSRQRGIFNQEFIDNILHAHAHSKSVDFSEAIWALLCLELWFQTYMDGKPSLVR